MSRDERPERSAPFIGWQLIQNRRLDTLLVNPYQAFNTGIDSRRRMCICSPIYAQREPMSDESIGGHRRERVAVPENRTQSAKTDEIDVLCDVGEQADRPGRRGRVAGAWRRGSSADWMRAKKSRAISSQR